MSDLVGYLIVGGVAAAVTAISTPVVAKFARQYGWMATPDARRSHPEPTPDVGGIAFLSPSWLQSPSRGRWIDLIRYFVTTLNSLA